MALYPLIFEPHYRRYLWGGRRLESVLNKPLPPGEDYAESWEVVDHGADQSRVANGPLRGETLHALIERFGEALLGCSGRQFPLLFKFLDAHRDLSLQVHPDDQAAARLDPPDLGKTEAWVVLHADPGSVIYAGLRRDVDRAALEAALKAGRAVECMHTISPKPGDCVMVPAGAPHALGAGLVIAEIQQSSDTTYRLFDWNRVGADGKPRPLHIEAGLEAINFQLGPLCVGVPQPVPGRPARQQLVACDKFLLERWQLDAAEELEAGKFQILAVIQGRAVVTSQDQQLTLAAGRTALIPAACAGTTVGPGDSSAQLLMMSLPEATA